MAKNTQDLIGHDCLILSGRHYQTGGKILAMQGNKVAVNVSSEADKMETVTCEQSEVVTIAQLTKRAVIYVANCGCWRSCSVLNIYGRFCQVVLNRGDIVETRIIFTTMLLVGEAIRDNTIIGKNCLFYIGDSLRGGDIVRLFDQTKQAEIIMHVDAENSERLTLNIDDLVLTENLGTATHSIKPFITDNARVILVHSDRVTLYDRNTKQGFNTILMRTNIYKLVDDILSKNKGHGREYKSNGK